MSKEKDSPSKLAAYATIFRVLDKSFKIIAPFAPFLSEFIYQEIKKLGGEQVESIHLLNYPLSQPELINPTLEDAVKRMQEIILLGRQKRNQVQIKVKTPLASVLTTWVIIYSEGAFAFWSWL
jgi:isoleucyl-tRNA synthetase